MSRNYTFALGEYYHIYSRGFEKSVVFKTKEDFHRFQSSLFLFNSTKSVHITNLTTLKDYKGSIANIYTIEREDTLVDIGCYALLNNHFHLLVREKDEDGKGISKFMQKLMTSYTMYFNKKYDRTGSLFSSSFKARHVSSDEHLKYLFAYIHLNPIKFTGKKNLKNYKYSSYMDYLGVERPERAIISPEVFPDYFSFENLKERNIEKWLDESEDLFLKKDI
ncbi:MAG: transposase [Candidatus Paceibacterota bacterium]